MDERFFKVGEVAAGVVGVLILCVLPATMSVRPGWLRDRLCMGDIHASG